MSKITSPKRVKQIRCHVGVQVRHQVTTSVDAKRHKVHMEVMPVGVFIKSSEGNVADDLKFEMIIPYANIHALDLEPEAQEK